MAAPLSEERPRDLGEVVHVRTKDDWLPEHRRLQDIVASGVDEAAADEHHGRDLEELRELADRVEDDDVGARLGVDAQLGAPRDVPARAPASRSTSSNRSGLRGATISSALVIVARMRWKASSTGSSSPLSVLAAITTGRSGRCGSSEDAVPPRW